MLKNFIDNYINAYKGISPTIWFLSIVIFINRSGTMVLFFLSLYLTQKIGFSIPFAGKMLSVYGIGSLLGAYLGGWASDKIGAVRVQLTALAISGGLYMIFILTSCMKSGKNILSHLTLRHNYPKETSRWHDPKSPLMTRLKA